MTFLSERLPLDKVRWPPAPARRLLAYLHSGDVLRQSLPWTLRIGSIVWLIVVVYLWLAGWPFIYQEFERWGLVKAFFAQMILLATSFLVVRITLLRADHLQALPPDDFVSLRALAVVCRWLAEIALVYVLGFALSSLLQPIAGWLAPVVAASSPALGQQVSSGSSALSLGFSPFSLAFVAIAAAFFLSLYSFATAIDVYLAIEFNTRAERLDRRIST